MLSLTLVHGYDIMFYIGVIMADIKNKVLEKVYDSEIGEDGAYTIPNGVEIVKMALSKSKKLKSVIIDGDVVETFGSCMGCSELESAFVGSGVKNIATNTFRDCSKLKNVTISEGVEFLRLFSFKNCKSLEEINLPDSIKAIGGSTFMGCSSLKKIRLSKKLKAISGGCFLGCTSLEHIDLPESIIEIGMGAFYGSGLKSIEIPQGTTKIEEQAFEKCENLEAIKLPLGVEILEDAFKDCSPNLKLYWTDKKGKVVKVTDANGVKVNTSSKRKV